MNILKEIILNQLIRIPAIKEWSKRGHSTGISHHPELLEMQYGLLTKYASVKGKDLLELGPGKTLEIVLKARQNGAASISIVDIEKYLTDQQIEDSGIDYRIYDGRHIPFADESFDLIWSSDVYEHLRFPKITVEETYRLLRPNGIAVHLIDLKDHFSYINPDPDVIFNCLKYPGWLWKMMTWNRSNYLNRLRASDFAMLHESVGFKILIKNNEVSEHIRGTFNQNPKLGYLSKFAYEDAISCSVQIVVQKEKMSRISED